MHASPTQPGYGVAVTAVRGKQLFLAGSGVHLHAPWPGLMFYFKTHRNIKLI